jgi:hypothetical protein
MQHDEPERNMDMCMIHGHRYYSPVPLESIANVIVQWHVLNIQCYPDHKHSIDSHDSTKHYVNGPEAFLTTLLAEFKDTQKRFEDIYNKISKLVTPPVSTLLSISLTDQV